MKRYVFLMALVLASCNKEAPKVDNKTKLNQDMASLMAIYTVDKNLLDDTVLKNPNIPDNTKSSIIKYDGIIYKDLKEAENLVKTNSPDAEKSVKQSKVEVTNLTKTILN